MVCFITPLAPYLLHYGIILKKFFYPFTATFKVVEHPNQLLPVLTDTGESFRKC